MKPGAKVQYKVKAAEDLTKITGRTIGSLLAKQGTVRRVQVIGHRFAFANVQWDDGTWSSVKLSRLEKAV